jgi:lipoprotein-releasing system permease protein
MARTKSFYSLPLLVGWRYTVSRREQRFISFVSLVSLLGLILGISAMVVVLSVMNGFDRELKQRILKVIPHGFVESSDGFNNNWQDYATRLKGQPGIVGVTPLIAGKGLLGYSGKTVAVEVNGVLPEELSTVSSVGDSMVTGSVTDLSAEPFGIILGQVLARRLGVTTGDKVQLLLPQINITPAGIFPRQKSFTVVGVFAVGADPDNQLALIHINSAARLFQQMQMDKTPWIKQLQIKTIDMENAEKIILAATNVISNNTVNIKSWSDTHRTLFNAVKMEKRVISLLLFAVIAVAVFNIASILVMMVAEKRKDIAILRVMGAESKTIMSIFVVQGMLVGLIGIGIGALFGSLLALYMSDIVSWVEAVSGSRLFNADIYYIARLPTDWHRSDLQMIIGVSVILCALATLYPAWKSGKIDPVQSLNE